MIAALAALLYAAGPARPGARAGLIGESVATCIAPVRPGESFADLLARRIPLDCSGNQTKYGSGDFWASSGALRADAANGELRLRMASLWQHHMSIGVLHADGHVAWLHASSRSVSRHLQLGAILQFDVPAHAAPVTRIVWRIDGVANRRGVLNGVHLADRHLADRSNLWMATLYAGFGGLALALLIYNFALWGALRHEFQLAYCLMLSMLLLYALSTSGFLAWVMPGIDNNNRLRINYMTLAASAAAALTFARTYFERRVFEGGLGRVVDIVIGGVVGTGIAIALFADWWIVPLDIAFSVACAALIAILPLIVWRAWAERSRYLWMFAMAWSAPIVMAAARIIQSFNLFGWNFWLDNSTLMAMAIEALLSSLAIAYRIRLLSAERDNAVAQGAVDRLLAATDPLTGLLNRRAFLNRAIGRAGRQQLLLIDIDHFKRVNETLGHDGGDEVLRVVARVLRRTAGAGTLVARLGGEEFALVADADAAIDPDRLLADLRATRMPFDMGVTASIGACTGFLSSDVHWKQLYKCADLALFEAKAGGRDRARVVTGLAVAA
ncbi:MAG TPA: diguanylate cyclase [Sphingomonas sp.]|nr:diguanylate cyclase [Sphingomonas sp.]